MPENGHQNTKTRSFLSTIFRKKSIETLLPEIDGENSLKKTLGAFDLTVLGIGAIIGAGIFTLSGTAAAGSATHVGAGPALILSFAISGVICCITALCYAELASMIPVAGSAYTYAYTTMGEIVAWMIGWLLMLEYAIGNITVACGWSGYFIQMVKSYQHIFLPQYLINNYPFLKPYQHLVLFPDWLVTPPCWLVNDYSSALHIYHTKHLTPYFPTIFGIPVSLNLPAIVIIFIMTALLYIGIKESARVASIIVVTKLSVILLFVFIGINFVNPANWTPFMPNGFNGVMMGAFLVFFAYIGFDAVSTVAEETKNPAKDLPIGIIASLIVCTIIYMSVAAVLTGMVPWNQIDTHAPIAAAMARVGKEWMAGLISIGAVAGLTSVLLVLQLGGSRILFSMARDRLIPGIFGKVHKKYKTPYIITVVLGCLMAIGTLFLDINKSAELCNVGTLSAFIVVCTGVIILRYVKPEIPRGFRVPLVPILPGIGALLCVGLLLYTFFNPKTPLTFTLIFFSSWVVLGLIIYFSYSINRSRLANKG